MAGRPPKYDPISTPRLVKGYARKGFLIEKIAAKLRVTEKTIYEWQRIHPEFREALQEGRDHVVARIEESGIKAAIGYEYEEVKIIGVPEKDEETGKEIIRPIRIEKTKKHYPPKEGLQNLYLKAYAPETYKDTTEVTGPGGGPILFRNMTDEEVIAFALKVLPGSSNK
jgi:hypothetical protein